VTASTDSAIQVPFPLATEPTGTATVCQTTKVPGPDWPGSEKRTGAKWRAHALDCRKAPDDAGFAGHLAT